MVLSLIRQTERMSVTPTPKKLTPDRKSKGMIIASSRKASKSKFSGINSQINA